MIKNNKLILKTQHGFRCERHNVFPEEINKIALSSNDYKRIHSMDSIEIYTINFQGFMNLCKKYTAKPYSFLLIHTSLALDSFLCFRKNLLQRILKKKSKKVFLNNLGLFFRTREKVLNNFKSRLFSTKNLDNIPTREVTPELAIKPTNQKEIKLKLQQ